jgi:hypothetical protein
MSIFYSFHRVEKSYSVLDVYSKLSNITIKEAAERLTNEILYFVKYLLNIYFAYIGKQKSIFSIGLRVSSCFVGVIVLF